jgi:hypothetical protein
LNSKAMGHLEAGHHQNWWRVLQMLMLSAGCGFCNQLLHLVKDGHHDLLGSKNMFLNFPVSCSGSAWTLCFRVKVCCNWACSPMVGRSSGTLPTRVQIIVLAPFPEFSRIYWRHALLPPSWNVSGKRHSRRRRGAIGDFRNLQICRCSVLRRCS